MPYKNKEEKISKMKEWRKRSSKEYMKWLYDRRMLPKRQREVYVSALNRIARQGDATMKEIAYGALEWAEDLDRQLGNRFDHQTKKGYWRER